MQSVDIVNKTDIIKSRRVLQLAGMFDLPESGKSEHRYSAELPGIEDKWNIGLIVGPSGCGKSTIFDHLYGKYVIDHKWEKDKAVVDGFPVSMPIKEITSCLNAVGFSSPPSWLKPYRVLSTGEKFRVDLAYSLATSDVVAIDEFTSVVDRTVAKIGSAAVAAATRKRDGRLVVATCHTDVEQWLQPDFVYNPATESLRWRRLRRFPKIKLKIIRSHHEIWNLFRQHHYLSENFNKGARCYVAIWGNNVVAMVAILPFPHYKLKNMWRGHRLVCLPDYQGVGIGNRLSEFAGALCAGNGKRYRIRMSHPALINRMKTDKKWRIVTVGKTGSITGGRVMTPLKDKKTRHKKTLTRNVVTAEYVGSAMDGESAKRLWDSKKFNFDDF